GLRRLRVDVPGQRARPRRATAARRVARTRVCGSRGTLLVGVRLFPALPRPALRGDGGGSPVLRGVSGSTGATSHIRQFLPRLRPYAGRLALAAVGLVIAAGVGLAFPMVVREMLDAAFENRDRARLDRIALLLLALFALQGL